MPSPLIQFRLKVDARQALEALALPGESLSICAQRLVIEALQMSTDVDRANKKATSVDKNVDNRRKVVDSAVDEESLIERLIPAIAESVRAEIESRLGDLVNNLIDKNLPAALDERLGKE
ncbi:hypothetical protein [Microcoleus sp. FACHB-672]|uniref:hypothetical protein n=1 Tax=Microcoleus sp. FACHB-672 TaxID=2692825 RepID=UPI0016870FDF|nr:hypothetical protein [Microcoleus sp. FACHB-672]MBD2039258.1 hypothetical protein [Microcoleus sp. FACHB-672]